MCRAGHKRCVYISQHVYNITYISIYTKLKQAVANSDYCIYVSYSSVCACVWPSMGIRNSFSVNFVYQYGAVHQYFSLNEDES